VSHAYVEFIASLTVFRTDRVKFRVASSTVFRTDSFGVLFYFS